ncbi:SHOCT domain-containing protein [Nocardioides sp. Iso805N]|uniref:SHOCT domain-containing protein n=1 Tax=Nocardioides sp. Iso805N TaxID=1283287 RepID=UPI000376EAA9|nr:SHOCT domain-containing protein [Nocardioides sp. Iso805N]
MKVATERILGALAVAALFLVATPVLAFADDVDDLCDGDPSCTMVNQGYGSGPGIPAWFPVIVVLVICLGLGTTIYRVRAARGLARKAGLDEAAAGSVALLEDNGLSAAYLASSLRAAPSTVAEPPGPPPRPAAERLAELQQLKDSGVITEGEYATRRQAIIDSV